MAERNPPSWLGAGSHPAEHDRLLLEALVPSEGVVGLNDLLVSPAATPNMTVDVAAGAAFVSNDLATHGGNYHVYNDDTVNLAVAPADPTNPRKDLVVARVRDSEYAGGSDDWSLVVLEGTPAASPAEPSIPLDGSYLTLALVDVPAGATAITSGEVTDRRARAAVPANNALPVGAMIDYAAATAPAGWLVCDGAAVSRTAYAALFAAIGTTWGTGDGSTTFNLPDSRGRTFIGAGQGPGLTDRTVGQTVGTETHQLALSETPAHAHTVNSHNHSGSSVGSGGGHSHGFTTGSDGAHTHGVPDTKTTTSTSHTHVASANPAFLASDPDPLSGDTFDATTTSAGSHSHSGTTDTATSHTHGVTVAGDAPGTSSQGGDGAHNNMQPSAVATKLIKAF